MTETQDRRPLAGAAITGTVNTKDTRDARDRRLLEDFSTARRLRDLPEQCRLLLAGLHNDANDASLVFAGLSFRDAFHAASRDIDVWLAFQKISPDDWR